MAQIDSNQNQLYSTWSERFIVMAKGFTMGAADIIPGVSGGTIALISGIYEHLIGALSSLRPRHILTLLTAPIWLTNPSKRAENQKTLNEIPWFFLIFLAAGIAIGILSMSKMIPYFMDYYPYQTYSFFFGLILFSITIPFKMMKHGILEWIILIVFTAVTFWIVLLSPYENVNVNLRINNELHSVQTNSSGAFELKLNETPQSITVSFPEISQGENLQEMETKHYITTSNTTDLDLLLRDPKTQSDGSIILKGYLSKKNIHDRSFLDFVWIWFTAAITICAMILPGISGAYILVLLGEYRFILQSLQDFDFAVIGVFVFGIISGILAFVHILRYLLKNYHSVTMAALTGFLAGSLAKIWPLSYLNETPSLGNYGIGIGIAASGAVLLFMLEWLSNKMGDPAPPSGKE